MGVYHFMGLGRSIGATTCVVDYIEKCLAKIQRGDVNPEIQRLFGGSGGIRHDEALRGSIEAIVFFTSKEVINRKIKAYPYLGCAAPQDVRAELVKGLKKTWKNYDIKTGRKIFWCEVDINNFQDCFDKVLKTTYRFSAPGKQGKEIWCNLTAGTNAVILALLSMSSLTAKSVKHYMITQRQEFNQEVTVPGGIVICPDQDNYFNSVPFLKTYIDASGFYEVLLKLSDIKASISTEELFSHLKSKVTFQTIDLKKFKSDYMLRLFGLGYISYDSETDLCRISNEGQQFVNEELPEILKIIDIEDSLNPNEVDIVTESKSWPWFSSENLDQRFQPEA